MKKIRIAVLSAVAAGMVVMSAAPSLALDTVTQEIIAGSRSASIANLGMQRMAYSNVAQLNTGSMTLTAEDNTGSALGWNVTVQSSNFVYAGTSGGSNIPAANFSLTAAADPVMTVGQLVSSLSGPRVPVLATPVGTLDQPRKTVEALAGFGQGAYTQNLGVALIIPAQAKPGNYTATLTTTISEGP